MCNTAWSMKNVSLVLAELPVTFWNSGNLDNKKIKDTIKKNSFSLEAGVVKQIIQVLTFWIMTLDSLRFSYLVLLCIEVIYCGQKDFHPSPSSVSGSFFERLICPNFIERLKKKKMFDAPSNNPAVTFDVTRLPQISWFFNS